MRPIESLRGQLNLSRRARRRPRSQRGIGTGSRIESVNTLCPAAMSSRFGRSWGSRNSCHGGFDDSAVAFSGGAGAGRRFLSLMVVPLGGRGGRFSRKIARPARARPLRLLLEGSTRSDSRPMGRGGFEPPRDGLYGLLEGHPFGSRAPRGSRCIPFDPSACDELGTRWEHELAILGLVGAQTSAPLAASPSAARPIIDECPGSACSTGSSSRCTTATTRRRTSTRSAASTRQRS